MGCLSPCLLWIVSSGNHQHDYQHSHLDLTLTPKMGEYDNGLEAKHPHTHEHAHTHKDTHKHTPFTAWTTRLSYASGPPACVACQ